jgi:hypothetical protein
MTHMTTWLLDEEGSKMYTQVLTLCRGLRRHERKVEGVTSEKFGVVGRFHALTDFFHSPELTPR